MRGGAALPCEKKLGAELGPDRAPSASAATRPRPSMTPPAATSISHSVGVDVGGLKGITAYMHGLDSLHPACREKPPT
jgi:hypothetical protein